MGWYEFFPKILIVLLARLALKKALSDIPEETEDPVYG